MASLLVAHSSPDLREAVRRALRPRGIRVVSCRTHDRLFRLLGETLVDGILLDVRRQPVLLVERLCELFPTVPVVIVGQFRPDDGALIERCLDAGVAGVVVEGVDDAVVGSLVGLRTASARRLHVLRDAPRLLRLTETLQLAVWNELLRRIDTSLATDALASVLGRSREYLSREFAAGGAPNLKRVMDLVRVLGAAELLANPGYDLPGVVQVLRFSSVGYLNTLSRRIAGVPAAGLKNLEASAIVARFRAGRTRSRLP